eukprot:Hpha_TRINITY_DN14727_c0_g2::TRINITY_DN14727_c0_g2_i1::g.102452::m.102452
MVLEWFWGAPEPAKFPYEGAINLAQMKLGKDWWDRPGAKRVRWVQWRKRALVSVHCPPTAVSVACEFEEQLVRCGFEDGEGGDRYLLELPLTQCVNPDKCTWWRKGPGVIELRLIKKKGSLGSWPHIISIPGKFTKFWISYDWDAHTEEDDEEKAKVDKVQQEREKYQDHLRDVQRRVRNAGDPLGNFIGRDPAADPEKSVADDERYINSAVHENAPRRRFRWRGVDGADGPSRQRLKPDLARRCPPTNAAATSVVAGTPSGDATPQETWDGEKLCDDLVPTQDPAAFFRDTMREAGIEIPTPPNDPAAAPLPMSPLPEVHDVPEDESSSEGEVLQVAVNKHSKQRRSQVRSSPSASPPKKPPPRTSPPRRAAGAAPRTSPLRRIGSTAPNTLPPAPRRTPLRTSRRVREATAPSTLHSDRRRCPRGEKPQAPAGPGGVWRTG